MIAGTARRLGAVLALGSVLAMATACSDDDDATDSSDPTVPTAETDSTTASSAETAEAPTSTEPAPTTTELNPVPTTPAPPSTTSTTVELPTVATLVPQVPDELLTPEQRDPFHVNNSRPILPEHVPVIEAAIRAGDAFSYVASNVPINADAPELLAAPFTPEVLQANQDSLRARASRGESLDISQGITERPYVIGPVADRAVLYDCFIDGLYWVSAAGEPLLPTAVYPAGPGNVVQVGIRVDMVQRDGQWLVGPSQIDGAACA